MHRYELYFITDYLHIKKCHKRGQYPRTKQKPCIYNAYVYVNEYEMNG